MRTALSIVALPIALAASPALAISISPAAPASQLIGAVTAGTTYTVSASGTIDLCGSCNNGSALSFNPDGTAATTAYAPYDAFNSGPRDYDPSVGPTNYGYYGQGINLGALYGSFTATPTGADLFAIGYGTTFTASATGFLYGVISDTDYRDNPAAPGFNVTLAEATSAVPEPATWAMMIGGVGIAGSAMRRSRKPRLALARA